MLAFFRALVDTTNLRNNDPAGLHTYYITEFGKTEGERLYSQYKLASGDR
tara:strand:- start:102 stop:251 length:150 start_codon:yes stop_codon:yes gene_type:complete